MELYVNQQLGATLIKRQLGLLHEKSIYLLLKQNGIPSRTLSESAKIRVRRPLNETWNKTNAKAKINY